MKPTLRIFLLAGTALAILPLGANASDNKHAPAAGAHKSRVFASPAKGHAAATTQDAKPGHAAPAHAAPAHAAPAHAAPAHAAPTAHAAAPASHDDGGHGKPARKSGHPSAHAAGAAHWGYSGPAGPEHWGGLKSAYGVCGAGKMQSPIDIAGGLPATPTQFKFDYKISDLKIGNNGHTIQVDYRKGSGIVVNGRRFELLQFHFHAPSEHMIDGKRFPMEMHLVHKAASGELAVVGVMMTTGGRNLALNEFWRYLPGQKGHPVAVKDVAVNARDLLPADRRYHHYKGSLTTPPCSEGVNWFVLSNPSPISTAQVNRFVKIVGENARPVQPPNNRLLISAK